jgi:amino acid adenylation domain-containing protein
MQSTNAFSRTSLPLEARASATGEAGVAEPNPEQAESKLSIPTTDEQRRMLLELNQTTCAYPSDKCLHELVEAQTERSPERIAVIWKDQQLSYGELNSRANQLAHYLRSRGVGPNIRVAICLEPSLDFAVAVLAVLKVGGACVPLDPNYPQERLSYMLGDVGARVLVTEPGRLAGEVSGVSEVLLLKEKSTVLSQQSRTSPNVRVKPSDVAYVIYTSGSTGKPRGVLLRHAGLVNYNANMARVYSISSFDRVLQFCSLSFDIAVEELFVTWLSGATLIMKSGEMPLAVPEFLVWAERQGITVLDLPTAYWHEWMHQIPELRSPSPESLRLVIVGGEKASSKAYAAWVGAVGSRVRWINTYGPTEASIAASMYEPKPDAGAVPENIPIGRPVANTRIYLLDSQLNPVPVGVAGEVHIGGIGVAQGYLNRPELTAEKFIADPFSEESGARLYKTGDLARYLPSGEIEFVGRADDQVKIRGFRVELGEIEFTLARHPGVREVAVVASEDAVGDKRLLAYFVPAPAIQITALDLRQYLQQELPDYMVPSAFVVLPAMPMTPNGKIDRRGLPAPPEASGEAIIPADTVEAQLVRIWEDVLDRKPIGIRDNFFELGGHSLLAARLMHRTGQALGKSLPLAMLIQSPTVQQLAAALRQNGWAHHWSSLVPIQPGGSELPFFCVHGVGGNAIGFHGLGHHMGPDYPFYGLQSKGLDGKHPCHTTIEEMAAHYINEIRSVQPEGPYAMGGFSFGGLVAYEMAQQLGAQGHEVGLLVLFDTYPGNMKALGTSLIDLVIHPTWRHWVHDLPRVARKRISRSLKNWRVPQMLKDVRNSNTAAADRYVLRPYAGKATLIRAGAKSLRSSGDPLAAWNGLVANLDVHEIPGDHYDMLLEPQVERLAECLKSCIDKACAKSEPESATLQAG